MWHIKFTYLPLSVIASRICYTQLEFLPALFSFQVFS
jgi:hypothetical protein